MFIEMMFHAKALELLSQCYQNVEDMDEEHDLEVVLLNLIRNSKFQYIILHCIPGGPRKSEPCIEFRNVISSSNIYRYSIFSNRSLSL